MMKHVGVPAEQVTFWILLISAIVPLGQFITSTAWSSLSDKYSRKAIILVNLALGSATAMSFGIASSARQAVLTRALHGVLNNSAGSVRAAIMDVSPTDDLLARGLAFVAVANVFGVISGHLAGALLSSLTDRFQKTPDVYISFRRFPFILPNLTAGVVFLVGFTAILLCLQDQQYGQRWILGTGIESEPYTAPNEDKDNFESLVEPNSRQRTTCSSREIMTLSVFAITGAHVMAFNHSLFAFLHQPRVVDAPLQRGSGHGVGSAQLGLILTFSGLSNAAVQFTCLATITKRYGHLRTVQACASAFPIIYMTMPTTLLFGPKTHRAAAVTLNIMLHGWCSTLALPSSSVLLGRVIRNEKGTQLGNANGRAVAIGELAKAMGLLGTGAVTLVDIDGSGLWLWFLLILLSVLAALSAFSQSEC